MLMHHRHHHPHFPVKLILIALAVTLIQCAPAEFDSESVDSVNLNEVITPIPIVSQSDVSSPDGSFDFR